MVMVRSLHGLESSGTARRKISAETLRNMYFVTMVADIEVYCRQASMTNPEDYYKILLVYVDDVLCCLHNPKPIIDALDLMYDLRDGLVVPPKIYLESEIKKYQVRSGKSHWSMSCTQYVKNAIKTIEGLLKYE